MADRQDQHKMPWDLMILWGLSLPFWVGMLGMLFGSHALMMPVWIQFVLASVVQVVFGARFYLGAWASIRAGLLIWMFGCTWYNSNLGIFKAMYG